MTESFVKAFEDFKNLKSIDSYKDADIVLEKYAYALPSVSQKSFEDFATVFCKLASKSNEINFYSLWIVFSKRTYNTRVSDRDIFDDIPRSPDYIDKKALNSLILILGKNTGYMETPSNPFLKKISDFITEKISVYSFKDNEIEHLQGILTDDNYPNPKIRSIYGHIANSIAAVQKEKRTQDVNRINKWAFEQNFRKDDLLKILSFRSTYINMLYETIIKSNSTKDIVIEDYYGKHRLLVDQKVKELTGTFDKKGKEIVRKYAVNKVYKAIAAHDKFKHNVLLHNINNYQDEPFYADTIDILEALDGGDKNRDIKQVIKKNNYDR
jgi:hypothetical protein